MLPRKLGNSRCIAARSVAFRFLVSASFISCANSSRVACANASPMTSIVGTLVAWVCMRPTTVALFGDTPVCQIFREAIQA
jgi:hypothetical protein